MMCVNVDSVIHGTDLTYEFMFGDGTRAILRDNDVVSESVTQAHVYRDGERHCLSHHLHKTNKLQD